MKQLTSPIRNWQTQKILWKCLVIIFAVIGLIGCGERYTEQGNLLSEKVISNLIERGLCNSPRDCNTKLGVYVGHGDQVRYTMYDVKDKKLMAAYIEFVIANGIAITGGVPISILVYPKSKSEYTIFSRKQSIIEIEVKA